MVAALCMHSKWRDDWQLNEWMQFGAILGTKIRESVSLSCNERACDPFPPVLELSDPWLYLPCVLSHIGVFIPMFVSTLDPACLILKLDHSRGLSVKKRIPNSA